MKIILLISSLIASMSGYTKGGPDPNDLQIITAQYGADANWIDVTKQVRSKVDNNKLIIRVSNELAGDPVFGVVKTLKVKYKLNGVEQQIEKQEGRILRICKAGDDNEIFVAKTQSELLKLAKKYPGQLGFYAKNLKTQKIVEYRSDEPACMASMVKVFVLLEIVKEAEQGRVDFNESVAIKRTGKAPENWPVSKAMYMMIAISDNDATNALAAKFGYDKINSLPKQLGINEVSQKVLPEPGILDKFLDKRVFSESQKAGNLYPQHATARGMAQYYELLCTEKLINPAVSKRVLEFLNGIERDFAPESKAAGYKCIGKGGSSLWIRPFHKHYNMVGWAGIAKKDDTSIVFCIWSEFFPTDNDEPRLDWLYTLTDSMIAVTE